MWYEVFLLSSSNNMYILKDKITNIKFTFVVWFFVIFPCINPKVATKSCQPYWQIYDFEMVFSSNFYMDINYCFFLQTTLFKSVDKISPGIVAHVINLVESTFSRIYSFLYTHDLWVPATFSPRQGQYHICYHLLSQLPWHHSGVASNLLHMVTDHIYPGAGPKVNSHPVWHPIGGWIKLCVRYFPVDFVGDMLTLIQVISHHVPR